MQEREEMLSAISRGEIDALVVTTSEGEKVFTLKSAEQPYRIFIEEMNQGAILLSEDDAILYCNNAFAKMAKSECEKIVGEKIQNYIAPMHLEAFLSMIQNVREQKIKTNCTLQIRAKGGTSLSTEMAANLLTQEGLNTVCLVVTDLTAHMQDEIKGYTEKLESEVQERTQRLVEAKRLATIGETASMVGHDIRNPLQSIVSELFLAKEELEYVQNSDAKQNVKQSIGYIEEQIFYINKIVADLQDYTKPLTPSPKNININDTIKESLVSMSIPSNVEIETSIERNASEIYVDPLYLKRILVNLISNALQAMPNGGKLTIKTTPEKNQAKITIKDTGHGIPEDLKPKVFQPLFTTKAKGQGLGLSVVKRLVEASGGKAIFESQVGEGTTFIITLPLNKQGNIIANTTTI